MPNSRISPGFSKVTCLKNECSACRGTNYTVENYVCVPRIHKVNLTNSYSLSINIKTLQMVQ